MSVICGIALFAGLFNGVAIILMVQDIEVQRKRFRRYLKQIDTNGGITEEVGWWEMRYGFFVRSGWLFWMPSESDRPDLAMYPELVLIRQMIKKDWRIIAWLSLIFVPSIVTFWLCVRS